jgi:FdhD protein
VDMYESRKITRWTENGVRREEDRVVRETPLTIMLNNRELATIVCSPYAQRELVVGFLAGEGLVRGLSDIKGYFYREEQEVVWVVTESSGQPLENFLRRNFSSCCGKGRPSLYFRNDSDQVAPLGGEARFTGAEVLSLIGLLDESSETFRLTGGVHSAALADNDRILVKYEDIGRHNALDRVLGHAVINGIETSDKAVLLSGRISSEMLVKAARIGAPVVISRSAPTGLAIDLAEQLNLTVVGFARGSGMNIYCHAERILG